MKEYHYLHLGGTRDPIQIELNRLAEQGWTLHPVAIVYAGHTSGLIFEREKQWEPRDENPS